MIRRLLYLDQKLPNGAATGDVLLRLPDSFSSEGIFGVDDWLDDPFLKEGKKIFGVGTMRLRGGDICGEAAKKGDQQTGAYMVEYENAPRRKVFEILRCELFGIDRGGSAGGGTEDEDRSILSYDLEVVFGRFCTASTLCGCERGLRGLLTLSDTIVYDLDPIAVCNLQDLIDRVLLGCDDDMLDTQVSHNLGFLFRRNGANHLRTDIQGDLGNASVSAHLREM